MSSSLVKRECILHAHIMDVPYPCVQCHKECSNDTIQCFHCQRWVHRQCVPLTRDQFRSWSAPSLQFLCRTCCFVDDHFDCHASLRRLHAVVEAKPREVKSAVSSERLLMQTYNVQVPTLQSVDLSGALVDNVSKNILRLYHPVVLSSVFPAKILGDGNCLYRSLSFALFGTESYHVLIRVFAMIEILENRSFYSQTDKKFVKLVNDNRIIVPPFTQLASDVSKVNTYADMATMYVLSAVFKRAIRSYYPPQLSSEFYSEPHSRKVVGRNVNMSDDPICTIMWTSSHFSPGSSFVPNHFVPLISYTTRTNIEITINDSCVEPSVGNFSNASYQNDVQMTNDVECLDHDDVQKSSDVEISDDDDGDDVQMSNDVQKANNVQNDVECSDDVQISDDDEISDDDDDDVQMSNDVQMTNDVECSDHDADDDDDDVHTSNNVDRLSLGTLDSKFLDVNKVLDILRNSDFGDQALESIPPGIKSNVYFLIKNEPNLDKRKEKKRSTFSDDCGVWNSSSGSTPKSSYIVTNDGCLKTVHVRKGEYHFQRRHKGKFVFDKLDPQPDPSKIVNLHRYYVSLKKDSNFKKRVSWLNESNVALVEYLGAFPGFSTHGNAKQNSTEYVRTPANNMQEMSNMLKAQKPSEVYNKLTVKYDELSGPANKKQVYDKKYNDRKKENPSVTYRQNLADHITHLENMMAQENTIVKSIIRNQGKPPFLILYNKEQILDIKKLCCTGQSLLGVDKTYNLCDMHVTIMCYKQTSVVRDTTNESPIFLGPVFIHDHSGFESYSQFFNHIRTELGDTDLSKLVIGSDEEASLVKAITKCFPASTHVLCKKHLEDNARAHLVDEAVDKSDREKILDKLFGEDGLINANDSICFEELSDEIQKECQELTTKFGGYFTNRLKQNIKSKTLQSKMANNLDKAWTNNNCESMNNVLKHAVDWKSQQLTQLVDVFESQIEAQFKELRRCLVGRGGFRLCQSHSKFHVSRAVWASKKETEREKFYNRFRNFSAASIGLITSTDGLSTIVAPRCHGKKPGQRKRKPNAKTRTTTKKIKI